MPPKSRKTADRPAARRPSEVPAQTLRELNAGTRECRNLAECLAVDLGALLKSAAPTLPAAARRGVNTAGGIVQRMRAGGAALHAHHGKDASSRFVRHPSDMVRGMACFAITAEASLTLPRRLTLVRPFADDPNSGVREWAWMAVREAIGAELDRSIRLLTAWTAEGSPFLRRFATESTRPRGVWCAHITALKDDPAPGLPLLEPLRADDAKYVQDSVSNWLNDAAKTRPDWVRALCARWTEESPSAATARICRRAVRSL